MTRAKAPRPKLPKPGTRQAYTNSLLEDIRKEIGVVIDAVVSNRRVLEQKMDEGFAAHAVRLEALEHVVRQNSEDIRQNSEDIRRNSEDILSLKTEVTRVATRVDGVTSRVTAVEDRVDVLERRPPAS